MTGKLLFKFQKNEIGIVKFVAVRIIEKQVSHELGWAGVSSKCYKKIWSMKSIKQVISGAP